MSPTLQESPGDWYRSIAEDYDARAGRATTPRGKEAYQQAAAAYRTLGDAADARAATEALATAVGPEAAITLVEDLGARLVPEAGAYDVAALNDVVDERGRQNHKWGEQNHPNGTGATATVLDGMSAHGNVRWIAADVIRDYLRAATDHRATHARITWRDILLEEVFEALAESDPAALRGELVQVAAVAVQWVECIDRKGYPVEATP